MKAEFIKAERRAVMTNRSPKYVFKSAISLIMAFFLLLPLILTACTADETKKSSFSWDMTKDEYTKVANEKIKYVMSLLFPAVYEQHKDFKTEPTLFAGATKSFDYSLFGYETDAGVSVYLTQELKLDKVSASGSLLKYEQLTEDQVEQVVEKLQKSAEPYGAVLTKENVSFTEEDGELMARCYVRVQTDDGSESKPLYEKIDPSWTKIDKIDTNEQKLRKITDPFVKEMFELSDLSDYKVSFENNRLQYRFILGGYKTKELITFHYSSQMTLDSIAYSDHPFDAPSDYLNIVTDKQLDKAYKKLKEAVGGQLSKKECILGTQDQYLTMYATDDEIAKTKVCTVYELAKDERAAIREKDPNYTPDYTGLSDEYVQMRKQADAAIMKKYGLQSFSNYDISIGSNKDYTSHGVSYTLMIGEYETEEVLHVSFDRKYEQTSIFGNFGEWSWLFSYISPEEIEAAIKRLDEKFIEETGLPLEEGSVRIKFDDNKNLYFQRSAVVDIEPEQGESHGDHYHYYQWEYLFVYNSLKKTSK